MLFVVYISALTHYSFYFLIFDLLLNYDDKVFLYLSIYLVCFCYLFGSYLRQRLFYIFILVFALLKTVLFIIVTLIITIGLNNIQPLYILHY